MMTSTSSSSSSSSRSKPIDESKEERDLFDPSKQAHALYGYKIKYWFEIGKLYEVSKAERGNWVIGYKTIEEDYSKGPVKSYKEKDYFGKDKTVLIMPLRKQTDAVRFVGEKNHWFLYLGPAENKVYTMNIHMASMGDQGSNPFKEISDTYMRSRRWHRFLVNDGQVKLFNEQAMSKMTKLKNKKKTKKR